MIRPLDAITLARTKIRSKRLRLLITTTVSALVFGVLLGATVLVDGAGSSLAAFAKVNLKGQYLVSASRNPMSNGTAMVAPNDPTMIAEVQALHATYIMERKAAAKRLGITDYDEKSEIPPTVDDPNPATPAEFRRTVNMSSVAYARWAKARAASSPPPAADAKAFDALIARYGPTTTYQPRDLAHLQLRLLVNGKEDLSKSTTAGSDPNASDPALQTALGSGQVTMVDDELVASYLATPSGAAPAGVPLLVTAEDAVKLFGKAKSLPPRPVSAQAQLDWFAALRDQVKGSTVVSCYRNAPEQARVDLARSQANEIESNKKNPEYVKPSLQLAMPTTPCGMVTVAKDTRTAEEKKAEENRIAFDREFSPQDEPLAELVTFQIVGLLPSSPANLSGVDQVLSGLLGTSFTFGAVIPQTSWSALPADLRHEPLLTKPQAQEPSGMMMGSPSVSFIASFPSSDRARAAINANRCLVFSDDCFKRPFELQTYGSNYLAVDDIRTQLRPVLAVLLGIVFGIATLIIWAMMGRVMADSRRETAVFRAIGARRSDIMAVYLTYSIWVAIRIAIVAALIGAAIALGVEALYAGRMTTLAHLSYGIFAKDPSFSFIGVQSPLLWQILAGIVVMSLIAITPPLLRNIRRNPIRDMRDE